MMLSRVAPVVGMGESGGAPGTMAAAVGRVRSAPSAGGAGRLADPMSRLVECLSKLQGQMDRLGQIQAESVSTIGKLSTSILQLSHQVCEIKGRLGVVEAQVREQAAEQSCWPRAVGAIVTTPENPPLTPSIDPLALFSDPLDLLGGPLVSPRRGTVLVVEDDVAYQWLVKKHLEAKGIDCVLALNAQEALAKLRESSKAFDLILMDIQLPGGINGLDTAQRIRSFDSTTPIVSMTSAVAPRQIASYLAGGMNDVLPKPFSRDGLLNLVARFCSLNLGGGEGRGGGSSGGNSGSSQSGSCIEEIFSGAEDNRTRTFIFGQPNPGFSF